MVEYVKISELPAAGAAAGTDMLEANQGGTTRRITVDQLLSVGGGTAYLPLTGGTLSGVLNIGTIAPSFVGTGEWLAPEGWLSIQSNDPGWAGFDMCLTTNPTDKKRWQFQVVPTTGDFDFWAVNDTYDGGNVIKLTQAGGMVLVGLLTGTTAAFTGAMTAAAPALHAVTTQLTTAGWVMTELEDYLRLEGGVLEGGLGVTTLDAEVVNAGYIAIHSDFAGLDFSKLDNATNLKEWLVQPQTSGVLRITAHNDGFATVQGTIDMLRNGGMTLSGALTGTTATFTSNVITGVAGGGYAMLTGIGADPDHTGILQFHNGATTRVGYIGYGGMQYVAEVGYHDFYMPSGGRFSVNTNQVTLFGPGNSCIWGIDANNSAILDQTAGKGLWLGGNNATSLKLDPAVITALLPFAGTSATLSTAIAVGSNDTTVATTKFVKDQGYTTTAALGSYLPLVGGTLTGPGNLTVGGTLTAATVTAPAATSLNLNAPTSQQVLLRINNTTILAMQSTSFIPSTTNTVALGGTGNRWAGVYGVLGDFTGNIATTGGINAATFLTVSAGNLTTTGGNLVVNRAGDAASALLYIQSDSGQTAAINFSGQSNADKWRLYKDQSSETTGNVGADFIIEARDNAGSFLSTPLKITRSTGAVTLTGALTGTTATFSGAFTAGLFDATNASDAYKINGVAALTRGTYTNIHDTDGRAGMVMGPASDRSTYYRNTAHRFQGHDGAADWANIGSTAAFYVPLTGTTATFNGLVTAQTNVNGVSTPMWVVNSSTGVDATCTSIQEVGGRAVNRTINYQFQYLHEVGLSVVDRFSDFNTHHFRNTAGTTDVTIGPTGALTGTTATMSGAVTAPVVDLTTTGGPIPALSWVNSTAPLNDKNWVLWPNTPGALLLNAYTDDWGTAQATWTFNRSGSTTLPGALTGTTATFTGKLTVNPASGDVLDVQLGSTSKLKVDSSGTTILYGSLYGYTANFSSALTGTTATFTGTVFAPGAQIQMASFQTGTVAAGGTIVPFDNTIPQITEGNEYMTCAITPKSAASKLVVTVTANMLNSTSTAWIIGCLFMDSVANALATAFMYIPVANAGGTLSFTHTMTSGTTSPITFRFRAGSHVAGTTTFNGSGGTQMFGSNLASSIVIREVAV